MAVNKRKVLEAARKFVQKGAREKALEHFKLAVRKAPRLAAPYLNLAGAYLRQAEADKARKVLERLLEVRPGQPDATELLRRIE